MRLPIAAQIPLPIPLPTKQNSAVQRLGSNALMPFISIMFSAKASRLSAAKIGFSLRAGEFDRGPWLVFAATPGHNGGRCSRKSMSMTATLDVARLRGWLAEGGEIAFIDVREEGQHGSGHPLLAVNIPYSRLEAEIARLVPRRSCRVVLVDDADGVAGKAARRLEGLGYDDVHVLEGGAAAWAAAGYRLFPSANVPSKAFAEIIEHQFATLAILAAELDLLQRSGHERTFLNRRPPAES